METLIHSIRLYRQDIGMELGIEKRGMLIMKNWKRETTEEGQRSPARKLMRHVYSKSRL